ncbi:MAG TPA: Uma2 family endonuclease [Streptosporangiaceae bacterium]|nr:Uma2 family endonuclease [Streptosporangiaceae bacterium]
MSEGALQLDDFNNQDLRDVADRLLETTRVEYVDEGALLIMNPPGIEHRRIVRSIVQTVILAYHTGQATVDWAVDENFQWEFADGSRRFFIPDIVLIRPDAETLDEERAAIALIVEVTSPSSRDAVFNDRTVKPVQYAKGGVPLYLLVDQELGKWILYGLAEGWQRYQIVAEGAYGETIPLPEPLGFVIPTAEWPRWLP